MTSDISRKIALFVSFILVVLSILTLMPDDFFLGNSYCHSCHDPAMPADHLLFRMNYLGYNSLCSFAPFSTLILMGAGIVIFLTTFKIKFERWGSEYRKIASLMCVGLAVLTILPCDGSYNNLLGGSTLCPLFPLSTATLLLLAIVAYAGYMVCPFMIIWRCRCPVLEQYLDVDRSPHRSINRYLKFLITGKLSDEDIERLYRCTLCNGCWISFFNRRTRINAVKKGIIAKHLDSIRCSVKQCGNPYNIDVHAKDGSGISSIDTLLFRGCTGKYRVPEILNATEKLLKKKDIKYEIMHDESCCGSTLYNLGDIVSANEAVDKNIAKFKEAGVKRIITVCPGCYSAFKTLYKGRDGFDAEIILAIDLLKDTRIDAPGAIIHDPCHAKDRHDIVHNILTGSKDESTGACCGAGGGLMSFDRMLSGERAKRIIEESPGQVITYCPFCYMNISRASKEKVSDIYMLMAEQEG
ncbi:Fe-S cluster protein [Methanocella sp. CWC-04]|uniref:Fe-S cluster protein n=1 Tax=Methanooceanicella nereidis TaxID=2052831 RepID=A0AAP2RBK0_9EURY|nr:(Fe-S)-binding protein [Methanocella sp. CWC-04]MCD1294037.1 Fe-S cluster protein [Methanocella sp. CWC-04]